MLWCESESKNNKAETKALAGSGEANDLQDY